jgi:UDP-N-acetylmuramyl pentapeptide synthase
VRETAVRILDASARAYLRRTRPRTVGIAGLQGKTVFKRWLREMFQGALRVRANPRSYNTDVGLPLGILDVAIDGEGIGAAIGAVTRAAWRGLFASDAVDVLVLEMGLRRPGDAAALLRAVVPDVLVLTPLAPSFSNDIPFLDAVQREVAVLGRAVAANGGAIVACADDARLLASLRDVAGVRTVRSEQARRADGGLVLEAAARRWDVRLDVVGESSVYALLAGIEVARLLGVDDSVVERFLAGSS